MGTDRFQPQAVGPPAAPNELPASVTADPAWILVDEGFTLAREHEVESLLAVGNGYAGVRGSLAQGSALSAPATVLAGVFDAEPGSVPKLVVTSDWTYLSISIDGHLLQVDHGYILEHRRILDMLQGMHWREWRHRDEAGRVTRLRYLRFASLADRHLLVQCTTITPENYSGRVHLHATLTGAVANITRSGTEFSIAAEDRIIGPGGQVLGSSELVDGSRSLKLKSGQTYRIDRVAALRTSRDTERPNKAARSDAKNAIGQVALVVDEHCRAWSSEWHRSDLKIEGDPAAQQAIRFAIYHLLSCANPDNEDMSIGARGLSGAGYMGHVFWDTEIFMLPFFILTHPQAARALLMYRYHRLAAARARAVRFGYRGALFPWESADTGEDVTPPFVIAPDGEVLRIFTGEQEQHISADVAYAVWNYWRITGDDRFLLDAGAEMLIETARFWASRAKQEDDGLYHIRGVIGPDEYHVGVDDNAYTNVMAQWNLETAIDVSELIAQQWPDEWHALSRRLGIHEDERQEWAGVARRIYTGLDENTGLYEQFRGYFDLEDIDLTPYESRTAPIEVLLGRDRIARSKVVKQPDVLMLIYLLWDRMPEHVRRVNFDYYEPRCGHGSSLSPAIHALIAARLGYTTLADRYFRQAAEIDLANNMGNAAAGVHMGALGGLWQAAVFGFAGLHLTERGPQLHPKLPASWRSLSMRFFWRQRSYELTLSDQSHSLQPVGADP
jgi:kojibiose phosphorylase